MGIDLTAAEFVLIAAVALAAAIAARTIDRRALARDGRLARHLLLALDHAQHTGPPPTAAELAATARARPRTRVRRAVALLEAIGLLGRDHTQTVITDEHLWIERRLHLNPAGRAAVDALHQLPAPTDYQPPPATPDTLAVPDRPHRHKRS